MQGKINKKIIIVIIMAVVLSLILIIAWIFFPKEGYFILEEKKEIRIETDRHSREMEELKKESLLLTEEEIEIQFQELEKIRQEIQFLSREEAKKQFEELENLRLQ